MGAARLWTSIALGLPTGVALGSIGRETRCDAADQFVVAGLRSAAARLAGSCFRRKFRTRKPRAVDCVKSGPQYDARYALHWAPRLHLWPTANLWWGRSPYAHDPPGCCQARSSLSNPARHPPQPSPGAACDLLILIVRCTMERARCCPSSMTPCTGSTAPRKRGRSPGGSATGAAGQNHVPGSGRATSGFPPLVGSTTPGFSSDASEDRLPTASERRAGTGETSLGLARAGLHPPFHMIIRSDNSAISNNSRRIDAKRER